MPIKSLSFLRNPFSFLFARSGSEDTFSYEFGEFNQLGFNVTLQAKF